jgi:nitronate monooxygenase
VRRVLNTFLTRVWALRYPLIAARMANAARGRLARAVTAAGGLGMIGVGNRDTPTFIEAESAIARGDETPARFGIGLAGWLLDRHPELLDAALDQKPFLLSISFGSVRRHAGRAKNRGANLAVQVNTRAAAIEAAGAGADLIVAQGTEAGGHTGFVGTLPLLQIVLDSVDKPVVAAGGIASARGVAAAIAAGAEGAWIGTALLLCPEADVTIDARRRLQSAAETDTILTPIFDRVNGLAWPAEYPGRTLKNRFTAEWHGREEELLARPGEIRKFRAAAERRDYDVTSYSPARRSEC